MLKVSIPHLFAKRRTALIIGVVVGLLIIGGGSATWAVIAARQNYQQSMRSWKASLTQAYSQSAQAIAADKQSGDASTKIAADLSSLQTTLKKWVPPAQPTLLGVSLLSTTEKQVQTTTTAQASKAIATLGDAVALIAYQAKIATLLATVNNQRADNLDQLKKASGDWSGVAVELAKVTPPEAAKAAHQKLSDTATTIAKAMAELIPLYEQQDVSGFTTKKATVLDNVTALQTASDMLAALSKTQDEAVTQQLQAVLGSLNGI